jgi:hypothetical protein
MTMRTVAPKSSLRHALLRGTFLVFDNPTRVFIVQTPKGETMRRFIMTSLVLVVLTTILACSSMTVRADHDSQHDFGGYSSFAIYERRGKEPRRAQMSPIVDRRIASAMAQDLEAKGFESTSARNADFLVTFYTAVRNRVVVHHGGWYGWGRWGRGWGWGGGARWVSSYPEGTLVVDVVDRRDRQLVWRGVGESAFTKMNPSDDKVAKKVAKIMASFPPVGN